MNTVLVIGNNLVIKPHGLDKLWGMRRELVIPLKDVRGATADISVASDPKGLRAPGLHFFGKVVGTFHRHGESTYWNINSPRNNLVIEFSNQKLARAVLTVSEPSGVEKMVNQAIQTTQ